MDPRLDLDVAADLTFVNQLRDELISKIALLKLSDAAEDIALKEVLEVLLLDKADEPITAANIEALSKSNGGSFFLIDHPHSILKRLGDDLFKIAIDYIAMLAVTNDDIISLKSKQKLPTQLSSKPTAQLHESKSPEKYIGKKTQTELAADEQKNQAARKQKAESKRKKPIEYKASVSDKKMQEEQTAAPPQARPKHLISDIDEPEKAPQQARTIYTNISKQFDRLLRSINKIDDEDTRQYMISLFDEIKETIKDISPRNVTLISEKLEDIKVSFAQRYQEIFWQPNEKQITSIINRLSKSEALLDELIKDVRDVPPEHPMSKDTIDKLERLGDELTKIGISFLPGEKADYSYIGSRHVDAFERIKTLAKSIHNETNGFSNSGLSQNIIQLLNDILTEKSVHNGILNLRKNLAESILAINSIILTTYGNKDLGPVNIIQDAAQQAMPLTEAGKLQYTVNVELSKIDELVRSTAPIIRKKSLLRSYNNLAFIEGNDLPSLIADYKKELANILGIYDRYLSDTSEDSHNSDRESVINIFDTLRNLYNIIDNAIPQQKPASLPGQKDKGEASEIRSPNLDDLAEDQYLISDSLADFSDDNSDELEDLAGKSPNVIRQAKINSRKSTDEGGLIPVLIKSKMADVKLPPINQIGHYAIQAGKPRDAKPDKPIELLAVSGMNDDELDAAVTGILSAKGKRILHKGTSIIDSTKDRENFYRFLQDVLKDGKDRQTSGNNPEKDAIKMKALLGKDGIKLYKLAIAEEKNSKAYRNAVFLKATKKYPGPKWKEKLALWVGGPSASGKSYGAEAIIKKIGEEVMSKEDAANRDGNLVVAIDGGIERDVSQMRKLLLQVAIKKGYPGIFDLHDKTSLNVKGIVKKAAIESNLNIVIPNTFTNLFQRLGFPKIDELPNTKHIFSEVVASAGSNINDFQDTVQRLGNTRAWEQNYGVENAADLEISFNNYDIKSESKRYDPNYFHNGRQGSETARDYYMRTSKDGIYVSSQNDVIFIRPESGTSNWKKCEKAYEGKMFKLSARDFARWEQARANDTNLPSPEEWLKYNTESQPIITINQNGVVISAKDRNQNRINQLIDAADELLSTLDDYQQMVTDPSLATKYIAYKSQSQKVHSFLKSTYDDLVHSGQNIDRLRMALSQLAVTYTQLDDMARLSLNDSEFSRSSGPSSVFEDNSVIEDAAVAIATPAPVRQIPSGTVLTITMLGTNEHRTTDQTILTQFHNAIETGDGQLKYLIDGVGGGPLRDRDHPRLGAYDVKITGISNTGEITSIKTNRPFYQAAFKFLGLIKARGAEDGIKEALAVIEAALQKATDDDAMPLTLNLVGYSRGADTIMRLCNELNEKYDKEIIKVHVFSIDPVPGPMRQDATRARLLPEIVATSEKVFARDERRLLYGVQDMQHTITQNPGITEEIYHLYPGVHSAGVYFYDPATQGMGDNGITQHHTTLLVGDDLARFARAHGTNLNERKFKYVTYSPDAKGKTSAYKPMTDNDRLARYSLMSLQHAQREHSNSGKRAFTEYETDYFLHGVGYFIDKQHLDFFRNTYPHTFDYFFQNHSDKSLEPNDLYWQNLNNEITHIIQFPITHKSLCVFLNLPKLPTGIQDDSCKNGIYLKYDDIYPKNSPLNKLWASVKLATHPVLAGFDKSTNKVLAKKLYDDVHRILIGNNTIEEKQQAIADCITSNLSDIHKKSGNYKYKLVSILQSMGIDVDPRFNTPLPVIDTLKAYVKTAGPNAASNPYVQILIQTYNSLEDASTLISGEKASLYKRILEDALLATGKLRAAGKPQGDQKYGKMLRGFLMEISVSTSPANRSEDQQTLADMILKQNAENIADIIAPAPAAEMIPASKNLSVQQPAAQAIDPELRKALNEVNIKLGELGLLLNTFNKSPRHVSSDHVSLFHHEPPANAVKQHQPSESIPRPVNPSRRPIKRE